MNASPRNAGFSLVEVMCAILILGIAMVGLTMGVTTALSSNKESELQTTAALFAAGQIEMLQVDGDLVEGTDEGECGLGLSLYRWNQTVSKTTIEGLYEVAVTVQHSKKGQPIYELRTMLFDPPRERESGKKASGKSKKRKGDSE